MTFELLSKLNWVDLVVVVLFAITIYSGIKHGLVPELFKLSGVIFATVVALHYYTRIGDILNAKSPLPLDLADFLSLLFLAAGTIIFFKLIRDGFSALVKTEVNTALNKWAGFALSVLRSFALSGLVIIILFSSNITYLKNSVKDSFSQSYLLTLSPRIYSSCFENLMVKFFPSEQLNTALFDNLDSSEKK